MRLKDQLLLVAGVYAKAIGRSEATVSKTLFSDGTRLKKMSQGTDMLSGNIEQALQTLSDRWPEGAAWPQDVVRPAPRPKDTEPHAASPDQSLRRAVSSGHGGEGEFGALPAGSSPPSD